MATIFTRIIDGELPGTFVWRDDRCVVFSSINPLQPGHVLVVPIEEVDHWIDADPDLHHHLMEVVRIVGQAIQTAFSPLKVGVMIAGLEVPHLHVHVVPIRGVHDLDFANAATSVDPAQLEADAERIRVELRAGGHGAHVPD